MRVLVTGGRDFKNRAQVNRTLSQIHEGTGISVLIHGNAKGADTLADQWAEAHSVDIISCSAQWDKYGKSAGYIRNKKMLEFEPDLVVAFKGGVGTRNMVNVARKAGIRVIEVGDQNKWLC